MTIAGPSSFAVWLAMPRDTGCVFAAQTVLVAQIARQEATTQCERVNMSNSPVQNRADRSIGSRRMRTTLQRVVGLLLNANEID